MYNRTRFCVDVNAKPRELLSVSVDKDDSLTVRIRSAEYFGHGTDLPKVGNHKISIHLSERSADFNLIHMTQEVEGRDYPVESHLLTNAIKAKTGFCPIYTRRCPNLDRDIYIPTDRDQETTEVVVIDRHDPRTENFIHSVLVGAADATFSAPFDRGVMAERKFEKFKIVLLSSRFFLMPTHPTGSFNYAFSIDTKVHLFDPETKKEVDRLVEGQPPSVCVDEFWLAANCLMETFTRDRLKCTRAPVPPGRLRDHLTTCLSRFSADADAYAAKVRPVLATLYREPSFWSVAE
jgi:hypothetical protein